MMNARKLAKRKINDLTGKSPFSDKKKLQHEIDPDNPQNPFWDSNEIFYKQQKSSPFRQMTAKSLRRIKAMTASPPVINETKVVTGNDDDDDDDDDDEPAVRSTDGPAVGSADGEVVELADGPVDGSADEAVVELADGPAVGSTDGAVVELASRSSVSPLRSDDMEVLDKSEDMDDLISRLIKKAKPVKGPKRKSDEVPDFMRVSKRAHGKPDIYKKCSCGCGGTPSDKNCPGCGIPSNAITMACWMRGKLCLFCKSKMIK